MTPKKQTLIRIGLFVLITFSLTWIPHFICLRRWGFTAWMQSPFAIIVTLTMFAPMLGNFLTRLITKEGFRESRLHFHFGGNIRYYVLAYCLPAVFGIIIAVLVNCTHGSWKFEALRGESPFDVFTGFMQLCVMPVLYYVPCVFGEECGWRGYMNQKLEALTGKAGAVVIGGVIWGLWHAPLVANGFNFGAEHPVIGVLLMCVSCMLLNAVLMWLTERTDSVFPAVLLHIALDMQLTDFVSGVLISGVSEEAAKKMTELQAGILQMLIPEAAFGILCFVLLIRRKGTARA